MPLRRREILHDQPWAKFSKSRSIINEISNNVPPNRISPVLTPICQAPIQSEHHQIPSPFTMVQTDAPTLARWLKKRQQQNSINFVRQQSRTKDIKALPLEPTPVLNSLMFSSRGRRKIQRHLFACCKFEQK